VSLRHLDLILVHNSFFVAMNCLSSDAASISVTVPTCTWMSSIWSFTDRERSVSALQLVGSCPDCASSFFAWTVGGRTCLYLLLSTGRPAGLGGVSMTMLDEMRLDGLLTFSKVVRLRGGLDVVCISAFARFRGLDAVGGAIQGCDSNPEC
jgi:hypothetical protein